jgi:hypothetical protein
MGFLHLGGGRPTLTVLANVLPVVLADEAVFRGDISFAVLGTAGYASVVWHWLSAIRFGPVFVS